MVSRMVTAYTRCGRDYLVYHQELREMYKHILATIPAEYQETAARSFIFASTSKSTTRTQLLAHHYLDDREHAGLDTLTELSLTQLDEEIFRTKERLLALGRGLLDINCEVSKGLLLYTLTWDDLPTVHLAHRSICDYLQE